MEQQDQPTQTASGLNPGAIARQLVDARLQAKALRVYPGPEPTDLEAAYACQQQAIKLWPDRVVGWKVGIVPEPRRAEFGTAHLVGPVFSQQLIRTEGDEEITFPIFEGGSAAVEAEFVFVCGRDVAPEPRTWTPEQAAALVAETWTAIETAGSPIEAINPRGPAVVASDFGNNAGLILGRKLPHSLAQALEGICTKTWIDDEPVGQGGAHRLPGGPLASMAGLLEVLGKQGRTLRAGDLISTGATTGVHDILIGQRARCAFEGVGELRCVGERAQPTAATTATAAQASAQSVEA